MCRVLPCPRRAGRQFPRGPCQATLVPSYCSHARLPEQSCRWPGPRSHWACAPLGRSGGPWHPQRAACSCTVSGAPQRLAPRLHRRHVTWLPLCPAKNTGASQGPKVRAHRRARAPQVDQVCAVRAGSRDRLTRVQAARGAQPACLSPFLGHCTSPLQQVQWHLQTSHDHGLEQMPWCSVEDLIQVLTVQSGHPHSPSRKLGPAQWRS